MYSKLTQESSRLRVKRLLLSFLLCLVLLIPLLRTKENVSATASTTIDDDRGHRVSQLVRWATANGAILPQSVALLPQKATSWGFVARNAISEGEVVCSIPQRLLVFPTAEAGSPVFELASFLLSNRNSSFVASLPWESFSKDYMFEFEEEIVAAREASDFEWNEIDFRTAVFLVMSRLHVTGPRQVFALVPLCDMFNTNEYSFNVDCSTAADESQFACRSVRPIKKGEELFVRYRSKDGSPAERSHLKSQWMIDDW